MARRAGLLAFVLVLAHNSGAVSMDMQTLDAKILDPRVVKCGVTIESGATARIKPFIETREAIAGKIAITVRSQTGSNSNLTSQTVAFPGNNIITVGRPSKLKIDMTATSAGTELCRLSEHIEFDAQGIRI